MSGRRMTTKPISISRRRSQRGASMVVLSILLTFVMIPIVGLGIDGSIVFWAKAKLTAAVDAAALATARTYSTATGQSYFAANFPTGFLGMSVNAGYPTVNLNQSSANISTATVQAIVTVPLYFMRLLHYNQFTLEDTGKATRRDANIMMVLDRSNSMNSSGSPSACQAMVAAAQGFLGIFVPTRDEVGLITFQTGANLDYAPSVNFDQPNPPTSALSLSATLGTLVCAGDTSSAQALSMAYGLPVSTGDGIQQMRAARPHALNVVLFFTDGEPNGLVANFPIKTYADTRYDPVNTSTLVNEPPSGCLPTDTLTGLFADGSAENATLNATGYTVAVLSSAGVPISNNSLPTTITAPGCAFPNSDWTYSAYGRLDVAYVPLTDFYGNSTVDGGFKPLDLFPAGGPYSNQIRPDMPRTARYASFNAADSIAHTIRNDMTDGGTVVYTIALQGNEPMAIDQNFMERMANDPRANDYDSTKPTGMFVLATDKSQLGDAFLQVASQILHLSQ